jgi:hypothetical protein
VFTSAVGTQRNANNVIRSFRLIVTKAGLDGAAWTPREMRHSFVSLLSDSGVPIENITRLVGHAGGSEITETVYRQQIRPVLLEGAEVMDRIFARRPEVRSQPVCHPLCHPVGPLARVKWRDRVSELEPPVGIEPMTYSLREGCGTALQGLAALAARRSARIASQCTPFCWQPVPQLVPCTLRGAHYRQ